MQTSSEEFCANLEHFPFRLVVNGAGEDAVLKGVDYYASIRFLSRFHKRLQS